MTGFSCLGGWRAERVKQVLGGPREKTTANEWYFQGGRMWDPLQGEAPIRQGGNGLPRKALNRHWRLTSRGQTEGGVNGGGSSSRWGLASGNRTPSNSRILAQQQSEENGAELAQPDTPAGLTEPLPQPSMKESLACLSSPPRVKGLACHYPSSSLPGKPECLVSWLLIEILSDHYRHLA